MAQELFWFLTAGLNAVMMASWVYWEISRGAVSIIAAIRLFGPGIVFAAIPLAIGIVFRANRLRRKRDLDAFHRFLDQTMSNIDERAI